MNEKKNATRYQSTLITNSARDNAREYQRGGRKARLQKEEGFFGQSLDYRNFVFSPEGYEGIVLSLYIAIIPYLAGLMFLFLFVAESNFEYFVEFSLTSFFVIWAIGYEVCAALIMAGIFLAWIQYLSVPKKGK